MSKLSAEFRFEIGDMVYLRPSVEGVIGGNVRATGGVVAERVAQECHGGIQRMYRLCDLNGTLSPLISELALLSTNEAVQAAMESEAMAVSLAHIKSGAFHKDEAKVEKASE